MLEYPLAGSQRNFWKITRSASFTLARVIAICFPSGDTS